MKIRNKTQLERLLSNATQKEVPRILDQWMYDSEWGTEVEACKLIQFIMIWDKLLNIKMKSRDKRTAMVKAGITCRVLAHFTGLDRKGATFKAHSVPALKDALKPYKRGHYAALSPRELPDFLKALDQNDIRAFPQTLIALELLMYTFVRTSELIKATWNEFDLENMTWEIPAERMKMRRPHIVPLSRQVMERLHRLRIMHPYSKYILPSVQSWSTPNLESRI